MAQLDGFGIAIIGFLVLSIVVGTLTHCPVALYMVTSPHDTVRDLTAPIEVAVKMNPTRQSGLESIVVGRNFQFAKRFNLSR